MNVPFLAFQEQVAALRPAIDAALARVLDRGWFILGEEVAAFEREWAAYCGVRAAVGVASGTDALVLALRAVGVAPGDEVLTTPHTATATVAAIDLAGARPVFVDIDPATCLLDAGRAAAAITPRTRALLPVHLYGQMVELAPLLELAERHGLPLIEDAAQAHGATYQRKRAGSWGRIGCFSFYPTKNLGAYGDGGALVTDDLDLATRLKLLRQYGWAERDRSQMPGMNSRLDELQAAILRVKLAQLDAATARRRELARLYDAGLPPELERVAVRPDGEPVYHLYVVRHPRRDALRQFLAERGIGTGVHYPVPAHLHPAYQSWGYHPGDFPAAERAGAEVVSLPLYPELRPEQVEQVIAAVREFGS